MSDESGYTRGEFLALVGAAAAGLGTGGKLPDRRRLRRRWRQAPTEIGEPDFVLLDGTVYTVEEDQPVAEAFAVKDGYFVAVGSSDDVMNLVGPDTEVFDAAGMTVTPGFIDTHLHPAETGAELITKVALNLRSIDALKEALAERAAETPPGEWVLGFMYDDTKYRDGRQITREDLDEAEPGHPVKVKHRGGHIAWYNSRAFELAGITVDTPDPPGGRFYRRDGRLDGKVAETANRVFDDLLPPPPSREIRRRGVARVSEMMTAAGLTTIHEGAATPAYITAYQDAYHAGEMRFRAHMMVSGKPVPGSPGLDGLIAAGVYSGVGDEWFEIRGAKFSADGSCSGRTMAMSTPYKGRPDDYGILTMTQEETDEAVERAHRHDFQIVIHANGDRAIEMVLNAYERAQTNWPRPDPRHRIEHCTLVDPRILRRIEELGVIPEPFSTYVHFHGNKWAEYGEEKMRWMFPHRSFLDYGIRPTFGSDYDPGPFEPLMGIQSCVTRKDMNGRVWGPNQRITVDEALRVGTINGARASFQEHEKGSIKAGKLADFVVLADDPHTVDPDTIKEIEVVRTDVGGSTMHEA